MKGLQQLESLFDSDGLSSNAGVIEQASNPTTAHVLSLLSMRYEQDRRR
jgi:hypothetical protein